MFLSGMVGTASGGSEKRYKITNKSGYIDCKAQQASAGETVPVSIRGSVRISIQTTSGLTIPTADGGMILTGRVDEPKKAENPKWVKVKLEEF